MKYFLLFFAIIISVLASAQNDNEIRSLRIQIDSLQQRLDETNYVRIPKQDFEKNLQNSVQKEVSDSIIKGIGFLAFLIGLIGFFIAGYFKTQIREQVEVNSKTLHETIIAFKENEKEINAKQDSRLFEIKQEFIELKEEQKNFISDSEIDIHKKINQTLSFVWDDIADSKMRVAEEKNHNGKELINDIKSLLENRSIEMRKEKRIALIDTLMRCYYFTNIDDKYKQMIKLLHRYEAEVEITLMSTTYANAAIALSNNYEYYGKEEDRDTCIDCCDKSLSVLPDYGLPYAIKMEVSMINFKKAFDDNDKQAALENIKRTFNDIKNNQSHALCYEIISRLDIDRKVPYLKEYIDNLENLFSDNLLELRERVCSDIIVINAQNTETLEEIFHQILHDSMMKTPNMDGEWVPTKIIQNGNEVNHEYYSSKLIFEDYKYTFLNNEWNKNGLVHFLPYLKTSAINFYQQEGVNYTKFHNCIFKIEENNQLTVCYGNSIDIRPDGFSSTPENENIIVVYNKVT
jgi:uncharacterized protein (TIGR03067 family)